MAQTSLACPECGAGYATGAAFCATCGLDFRDARDRTTRGVGERAAGNRNEESILDRLRHASIGLYDVAGELGRGGMAAVYLAHDIRLARDVAIKVMLPELTTGNEMVERFRREARTAGNLSHPHIIPIYHVHDEDGLVFFVMKYVEGRSLDSAVREMGPLPIPMVEAILSQTAAALAYAHRKGVIHRDIKPANLMLDEDGWAVVTDFGIAKLTDATMLTSTGATIGTPYYMSPEQCSAKPIAGASDQYSLGVTIYELLTGHPPFQGASLMEVMGGHFFTTPIAVREKRADCPPALEAIVMRMLAKEPTDRFASLDDVVTALKAPTLAHDDPVRSQMIDLARSGAKLRDRVSVPVSPVPATRASAAGPRRRSGAMTPSAVPVAQVERPVVAKSTARRWRVPIAIGALFAVSVASWYALRPTSLGDQRAAATDPKESLPKALVIADPPVGLPNTPVVPTKKDSIPTGREVGSTPGARSKRPERAKSTASTEVVRARVDTAPASSAPVVVLDTIGMVMLGTRTPQAFYYVDGALRELISTPRTIRLRAGTVKLSIGAEGCTPWDTTVAVVAGQTRTIGYRTLVCKTPPRP